MKLYIFKTYIVLMSSFFYTAYSQNISFTTSVSQKKIGVADAFNVTYTANKRGAFIPPKFVNFQLLGGPSQGSNTSVSFINGKMTQKSSHTFTYTLKPKKTGVFNIPGAQIKIGNAKFVSKAVKVTVVKESQVKQRKQRQRRNIFDDFFGDSRSQRKPQTIDDKSFFVKIGLSKYTVYEGEHVIASYKIYSKGHSIQLEDYNFPTHENFWTENIKIPETLTPVTETLNGIQYQVFTVKKEVLFPQKSGKLPIKSFDLTARLNRSFFGQGIQKKTTSNSPALTVKPLPKGAPESFKNQVGTYDFKATISTDTVKIDEPIDLKIKISGKGNLKQLNDFDIKFPTDFEVYDPETKNKLSVNAGGVQGSKNFNYLVIPRHSGTYEFGPLSFSYFDVATKTYKTQTSKKFKIIVLKADGTVDDGFNKSLNPDKEKLLDTELRYIEKETNLMVNGNYFYGSVLYYLLIILLVGLFFVFFFINKKLGENNADTNENRMRKAKKELVKKMAVAKSYLDANNSSNFYEETLTALYKYVNDKLQMETSQLSKENIKDKLLNKSVTERTANKLITVLETCEMSRFAPLTNSNNLDVYHKSVEVIEEIETEFKA